MTTKTIIFLCLMLMFAIGYCLGQWIGIGMGLEAREKKKKKGCTKRIYCFQCEIEMPVQWKNGRLYCTNCKLYHQHSNTYYPHEKI